MSLLSILRRSIRRAGARYMENVLFGGRDGNLKRWTAADEEALNARIEARVARERVVRMMRVNPRPAATKRNGGLRGSKATRWR